MARPRCKQIDLKNGGFVHLGSRCVRQAFICGIDHLTGKDYSHRRDWIEERLLFLASVFSVEVFGYAILDNHYHLLAYIQPAVAKEWSAEEIVRRWLLLYPRKSQEETEAFTQEAISNSEYIEKLRVRLSTAPEYMKQLNEYIARRANNEDLITGPFWGGRYFSKALKTDEDIISCLCYVDLNPVRAGIVSDPESELQHTSLIRRLKELKFRQGQDSGQEASVEHGTSTDCKHSNLEYPEINQCEESELSTQTLKPLVRGAYPLKVKTQDTGTSLPISLKEYRHRVSVLAQHGSGGALHRYRGSRGPPHSEPWLSQWLHLMKGHRRRTPARTPLYWWMESS